MAKRSISPKRQMHESTQRGLCQSAFMLAGLLPLVLTVVFCFVQSLSVYQRWRAQSCSTWLTNMLGVDVQVAAVESQTPNRYVMHGIRLMHPESRTSLGRVRSVEVTQTMGTWKLQLAGPEIDGRQLIVAWQLVHDWFVCRPHAYTPIAKIEMGCSQLEILNLAAGDKSFRNLAVDIFPKADSSTLSAKFCMGGDADNSDPTVLMIHRQHTEDQLQTNLDIHTGTAAIPADLLQPLFPQVSSFGNQSTFRGQLKVIQKEGIAWHATLEDVWLSNIDFASLTSSMQTPVIGQGFLWLKQADIGSAGLNEAKGAIAIGQGRLDAATLDAGKRLLGIELSRPTQANVGSLPFTEIKAAFALNRLGLSLQGEVEPTYNTLIADAVGKLAIKKNSSVIPIQNLYELFRYHPPVVTASAEERQTSR